jgi:hypothetical protein
MSSLQGLKKTVIVQRSRAKALKMGKYGEVVVNLSFFRLCLLLRPDARMI